MQFFLAFLPFFLPWYRFGIVLWTMALNCDLWHKLWQMAWIDQYDTDAILCDRISSTSLCHHSFHHSLSFEEKDVTVFTSRSMQFYEPSSALCGLVHLCVLLCDETSALQYFVLHFFRDEMGLGKTLQCIALIWWVSDSNLYWFIFIFILILIS